MDHVDEIVYTLQGERGQAWRAAVLCRSLAAFPAASLDVSIWKHRPAV